MQGSSCFDHRDLDSLQGFPFTECGQAKAMRYSLQILSFTYTFNFKIKCTSLHWEVLHFLEFPYMIVCSKAKISGIQITSFSRTIKPLRSSLVSTRVTVSRAKPLRLLNSRWGKLGISVPVSAFFP